MDKLVGRLMRAPRLVLTGTVIVVLLCAPLMTRLSGHVIPGGFEDPKSSAVTADRILADDFHIPANTLAAVVESDGDVRAAADRVVSNAQRLEGFRFARSYRDDPLLIASSGRTAVVQVMTAQNPEDLVRSIADVRSTLSADLPAGATVRLTGEAALNSDYNDQTAADALLAESIAFPVLIILLLIVFRSVIAMLVPITVGVITLVVAQAVGGAASFVTDISNLYVNAVSIIGLAVSVDYSLFIMRRYTQERDRGRSGSEALLIATRTTGRSVLFGGVIVMLSLAGLFIPNVMVLRSIAIAGISATAVAMVLSAVTLPAILTLWGDKIYARNRYLVGKSAARQEPARSDDPSASSKRTVTLGLLAAAVMAVSAVPMALAHLQVPVAGVDNLPSGAESRVASQMLTDQFGLPREQPIDLVFRAASGVPAAQLRAAVDTVRAELTARTDVARVEHPAAPVDARNVERLIVFPESGSSARTQHTLVGEVRKTAGHAGAGIDVHAGGVAVVGYDFDRVVMRSLPLLIGAVLILGVLLLYWVFRSWAMALCAVALNNLVIGSTVGLLILIYQAALDEPVSSMQPVLIFAVMFGMSMDYLIVMASRMREEYQTGTAHTRAVTTGLRATTPVITVAAAVMATVFLSFLVAKIAIVAQLGTGLAIAVILDAVVLRRLVVPAVFQLVGPRLWGRRPVTRDIEPRSRMQSAVS